MSTDTITLDNKPKILSDEDYRVLLEYQKPKKVNEEDRDRILKLMGQGYMNPGFHEEPKEIYETAKTINMGNKLVNLAQLSRNQKALKFFRRLETISRFI